MAEEVINVLLTRVDDEYDIVVSLKFCNNSDETMYLALPRTGYNNIFDTKCFDVMPTIPYTRMQTKRSPYTVDELISVEPYTDFTVQVNLSELFDFESIKQAMVRYRASHPLEGVDSQMETIESNWLELFKRN